MTKKTYIKNTWLANRCYEVSEIISNPNVDFNKKRSCVKNIRIHLRTLVDYHKSLS